MLDSDERGAEGLFGASFADLTDIRKRYRLETPLPARVVSTTSLDSSGEVKPVFTR